MRGYRIETGTARAGCGLWRVPVGLAAHEESPAARRQAIARYEALGEAEFLQLADLDLQCRLVGAQPPGDFAGGHAVARLDQRQHGPGAAFDRAALAIDAGASARDFKRAMTGIIERILGPIDRDRA